MIETNKHWTEHWVGMPEFINEKKEPFREITMKFRSPEDMEEFSKKVEQTITWKTIAIWFPKLERGKDNNLRYVTDE